MRKDGHPTRSARTQLAIGLFLGLMATAGFARSVTAQVDFGILLGLSSSSLEGDSPPNGTYTRNLGPIAGLSADFGIGDGLYLIAQPQYVERGTGVAFAVEGQEEPQDSLTLSLRYVSIPVGLKVTTGSVFYVSSVLDLGILTSATFDNGSTEQNVKSEVDSVDLAVGLGIGGRFSIGRRPITLELRYSQSLLNLPKDSSQIDEAFPTRFRVAGFQLVAGIFLGLGGG